MTLKILTIDDDPGITKLLSLLLGSYGMTVIMANKGEDGIQLVRTESPDLVLLDMMMPGMNGMEVSKTIRSFCDVPILAFSALANAQEVAAAMNAGVSDYLEKPAPADILVERINKLTLA